MMGMIYVTSRILFQVVVWPCLSPKEEPDLKGKLTCSGLAMLYQELDKMVSWTVQGRDIYWAKRMRLDIF